MIKKYKSEQDKVQNNPLNNSLKWLTDRMEMQKELIIAKEDMIKEKQIYDQDLQFQSLTQLQDYRLGRIHQVVGKQVMRTIIRETSRGKIFRSKKIEKNTDIEEMNRKYGNLNLDQKVTANIHYNSQQKQSKSPLIFDKSDQYHNIEGQLARMQRLAVIKKFSPIFIRKKQIEKISKPPNEDIIKNPHREALKKIITIGHQHSERNILPILKTDPNSVELVIRDLENSQRFTQPSIIYDESLWQLSQKQCKAIRIPRRVGGGFTRRNCQEVSPYDYYYTK